MTETGHRVEAALRGRYAVQQELGSGGMAFVYLAEDVKHHRQVAIKVLRPEIAAAVGHERFLREIEIAARLTHPHIVSLIDSGESAGLLYYVMPFVEGESLRARLTREKELPIPDAVRILRDVGDALAYAHAHGVVHRDIKPDNVMLPGRHAVVTDFGVAKAVTTATGTQALTSGGIAIGTPAYMAPEQAMGDPNVDHRADVYAFGVLAYELVTGEVPFSGGTAQDVLAKHVTQPPRPPSALRPSLPVTLDHLILKCLEKRPADRWQSAEEAVSALEALVTPGGGTAPTRARLHAVVKRRPALLAAALLGLVAVSMFLMRWRSEASRPSVPVNRQLTFRGDVYYAEISPDGSYLAYLVGDPPDTMRLVLQDLVGGGAPLTVASLAILGAGQGISWWPDGSRLLVQGWYQGRHGLYLIPRLGGTPSAIPRYGVSRAVSPDGSRIAFWTETEPTIRLWSPATGDTSSVRVSGSFAFLGPIDWSPSGDLLAFVTHEGSRYTLWTIRADGTSQTKVADEDQTVLHLHFSRRGDAVYYLAGGWRRLELASDIRKVRLTRSGAALDPPDIILTGLPIAAPLGYSYPAFSMTKDDTRLVYTRLNIPSNLWVVSPPERSGGQPHLKQMTRGTGLRVYPRISPDGEWVAFVEVGPRGADVWKMPVAGGEAIQVTFLGTVTGPPAWSPSGGTIAFGARSDPEPKIWLIGSQGGTARALPGTQLSEYGQLAWSPGQYIVYQRPGNRDFSVLNPQTGVERSLTGSDAPGGMFEPHISPDGRQVAIQWNRPDSGGVWVIPLGDTARQRMRLGPGPRRTLTWTADGLYLANRSGEIHVAELPSGRTRVVATLPFRLSGEVPIASCDLAARRRTWAVVCARQERSADAWMIEHFDPAVR